MIDIKITFAEDVTEDYAWKFGTDYPVGLISFDVFCDGKYLGEFSEEMTKNDDKWIVCKGISSEDLYEVLQTKIDQHIN